jgi:hypothetical protein
MGGVLIPLLSSTCRVVSTIRLPCNIAQVYAVKGVTAPGAVAPASTLLL